MSLTNVACFMVLFYEAKLYADALLQIGFAVLGIVGWWQWTRAAASDARRDVPVTRTTWPEVAVSLAISGVVIWLGSQALRTWTDSPAPIADTTLLVLSVLATWWQVLRRLECWVMWIVVDLISIPLYWQRSLPLTAMLYVVFLLICIAGFIEWRRAWHGQGADDQLPLKATA